MMKKVGQVTPEPRRVLGKRKADAEAIANERDHVAQRAKHVVAIINDLRTTEVLN